MARIASALKLIIAIADRKIGLDITPSVLNYDSFGCFNPKLGHSSHSTFKMFVAASFESVL